MWSSHPKGSAGKIILTYPVLGAAKNLGKEKIGFLTLEMQKFGGKQANISVCICYRYGIFGSAGRLIFQ